MSTITIQQSYGADSSEGSATQQAYNALRRMIIQGELKPCEKLKIDGLCKRLFSLIRIGDHMLLHSEKRQNCAFICPRIE